MTNNIEDFIRTAQEAQAARAVPTERIRAALPQRAAAARRRRRFGVLGATVVAAGVAAAVTVPALALRGPDPEPTTPTAAALTSAAPSPSVSAVTTVLPASIPLGYKPTWTPAGFHESIRQADTGVPSDPFGPTLMRVWKKQVGTGDPWGGGAELTLYVRTGVPDPEQGIDTSGQKVDVNGARGWLSASQGDGKSSVNWIAGPHTVLMIATGHVELGKADLLRMARSVRPDPGSVAVPVRLPWLPDGWTARSATVSGPSMGTWRAEIGVAGRAEETTPAKEKQSSTSLSVVVGIGTDAPAGGQKLTVGGHPARHPVRTDTPGQRLTYLVVDLGHDRMMTLIGDGLSLDELTRIAEHADIDASGVGWLDH